MIVNHKAIYIIKIFIIASIYLILGKFSFAISHENSIVTIVIFASEGFALASILLFGRKVWIGIFIGQFLLAFGTMPILAVFSIALVNSLEALLALYLFNYFKLDIKLSSTRDIFGLIGIIVLVLQPFSAFYGNIVLASFSVIEVINFSRSFFSWWFGNIMGQILFVPTILLLHAHFKKTKLIKLLFIGLFFAFISYVFQVILPIQNVSLLLSVTLPLIIYISSSRGIQYATFAVIVITTVTLYLTHIQLGIFTNDTEVNNLINLNFYFLSQMLLLLIIGTLFDERNKREENLEILIEEEVRKNKKHSLMMLQQSRLAQMGQVLNMIAHQWRQPLNNLLLINDLFIYKYQKNQIDEKDIHIFQEEYTLQIKQMSATIDDFRDFFQPRKEKEIFLLNDIIEHLLVILEPIFKASDIQLIFKEVSDIYIKSYPNELAQALLNIFYNARDAFEESSTKEKKIIITLSIEKEKSMLEVIDNAGGIPEKIIDQIFDPYFSTKIDKNGTGIGLYMSKMIIEEHMQGKLSVKNNDSGATFTIVLNQVVS